MSNSSFFQSYKNEFSGYSWGKFRQDVLAGLTVAAVALPLALAFGVASGATAAVGLVTSIIASVAMGLLAGAPFQVSGPTAGLVGVLGMVAQRSGLQGIWLAGLLAGFIMVVLGLLKLGRLISYLPAPVITGFTSGVSLVLIIGQLDNFLGIQTPGADTSLAKLLGYFKYEFVPDWHTVVIGLVVIAIMAFWPKRWDKRFPSSLAGIVIATGFNMVISWPVDQIGTIPQTLLLPERLTFSMITWSNFSNIFLSAISIALLCAMESQLCGAVMSDVSGIPIRANQDLISQGVGNMVLPFFGCIPATATMVRSSVMLKSGGQTRIAGLAKGVGLLFIMFAFSRVMSHVPMAALAGVLMVIAWRINKWSSIRSYFSHRYMPAILVYLSTIVVTIATDLVLGMMAGVIVSILVYLQQSARLDVKPISLEQVKGLDHLTYNPAIHPIQMVSITGQLFFATTRHLNAALDELSGAPVVILSMGGLSLIDASGVEVLSELSRKIIERGNTVLFAGANKDVMQVLRRGGLLDSINSDNFFQNTDQAIIEAHRRIHESLSHTRIDVTEN